MLNVNGEILVILLVIMDKKQLKELGVISKKIKEKELKIIILLGG